MIKIANASYNEKLNMVRNALVFGAFASGSFINMSLTANGYTWPEVTNSLYLIVTFLIMAIAGGVAFSDNLTVERGSWSAFGSAAAGIVVTALFGEDVTMYVLGVAGVFAAGTACFASR